ncbi:MAG: hypothetical protein HKL96_07950 [Phycisphaerales bacterium]|nr:hypothetical protein [Phycisphaerales bacterium]
MMTRKSDGVTRRTFVAAGAVVTAGAALSACSQTASPVGAGSGSLRMAIPDDGWRLWLDQAASWRNDNIYLPEDVVLDKLPVNAPTGGWEKLAADAGIAVTLPSTVEQHYWGKTDQGLRPYRPDDYFWASAAREPTHQVQNGSYEGVSWWWQSVHVPAALHGKKLLLYIRGARQRAEVYLNRQLVGYNIVEETSFECDITAAVRCGSSNLLAIRITNPGGRFDWVDHTTTRWKNAEFQRSHGFGGLDRAVAIRAVDAVHFADVWVLNTPNVRSVRAFAELNNDTSRTVRGSVVFGVYSGDKRVAEVTMKVAIPPGGGRVFSAVIDCPGVKLWEPDAPNLYEMRVLWQSASTHPAMNDYWTRRFGFRWINAEGIGKRAKLTLNGRRFRLYTAISWGFWGINGLWPTPQLAHKEVTTAKRLGLNCLNFHRNIGKEEVLDQQDELGLLRYMEPGGGCLTQQPEGSFASRYEIEKLLRMIRQFRSHPSTFAYYIQDEWNPNLKTPRIFELLRQMRSLDASRIIITKDGIAPEAQAWLRADDAKVLFDHGNGWSGWWCRHTVGTSHGVWQDWMYKNPGQYMYRAEHPDEINEWGEVDGGASADNSELMLSQIAAMGGKSYDLLDHQQMQAACKTFLDQTDFGKVFATPGELFKSLGRRQYDTWSNLIENARISDHNDFFVISGWESTAIEDHSGIVDNLRNPKGPPDMIADKLIAVLPVAKPRSLVVEAGKPLTVDIYLVNESHRAITGMLDLTATDENGRTVHLGSFAAPAWKKDQFSYLLHEGFVTIPLASAGMYRLTLALRGDPKVAGHRDILVVGLAAGSQQGASVCVQSRYDWLAETVYALPGVSRVHDPAQADVLIASECTTDGREYSMHNERIAGTDDPQLYRVQRFGTGTNMKFVFNNLPDGPAQVYVYFAETMFKKSGQRVFNLLANGHTVLDHFDIAKAAGEPDRAIIRNFSVNITDGRLVIAPGPALVNSAMIAAIKILAGKTVKAAYFGKHPFRDHSGQLFQPWVSPSVGGDELVQRVRNGARAVYWASGSEDLAAISQSLAAAGSLEFRGMVGENRAAWMGCWVFTRTHPVFESLPVNSATASHYQIGTPGADGAMVYGPAVEVIAGYGRDHDRNYGAAAYHLRAGKGRLLVCLLPQIHPVVRQRVLQNSIRYLMT